MSSQINMYEYIKNVLSKPYEKDGITYKPKFNSTGSELIRRCPICGDSDNKSHAHCYIGFVNDSIMYHCKKCGGGSGSGGVITPSFMHKSGIFDDKIDRFLESLLKNVKKTTKRFYFDETKTINTKFPSVINEKDIHKCIYFEKRVGVKLTKSIIEKYKLIINVKEYLDFNGIDYLSGCVNKEQRSKRRYIVNELSKSYFGALSFDGNIIICRRINDSSPLDRYVNFTVDPTAKKPGAVMYVPRTTINIESLNPKICISEGIFDTICTMEHLHLKDDFDTLHAAVCGKGSFDKGLSRLIHATGFIDAKVVVYCDSEVTPEDFREKRFKNNKWFMDIKLLYNKDGKDFGDINPSNVNDLRVHSVKL